MKVVDDNHFERKHDKRVQSSVIVRSILGMDRTRTFEFEFEFGLESSVLEFDHF
jgi:hypothetical protein